MTEVAVRAENLSKKYRIGGPQARRSILRENRERGRGPSFGRRLQEV
jgi:hypothetical protein